ncbi:MAG: hypothetical protein SHS37scaffold296_31 [Burkholderiales phage 68_11]|nr:MAG: hypothetical protein SHS37scaffold296_31 [Burkholderiales phage 68_11]
MSAANYSSAGHRWAKHFQHDRHPGAYLVTLDVGISFGSDRHGFGGRFPQCWCVVDDFGNLVTVGAWR